MKIVIIEDEEITSKDLEDTIVKINPEHTVVKRLFSVTESIAFFKENNRILNELKNNPRFSRWMNK